MEDPPGWGKVRRRTKRGQDDGSASRQREVLQRLTGRIDSDYMSAGNAITRLSVTRIYGDSTTIFSTTRHVIQHLWNGYRSYKSPRERYDFATVESAPATRASLNTKRSLVSPSNGTRYTPTYTYLPPTNILALAPTSNPQVVMTIAPPALGAMKEQGVFKMEYNQK